MTKLCLLLLLACGIARAQPLSQAAIAQLLEQGRYVEARRAATDAIAAAAPGGVDPCALAALHHLLGMAENSLGDYVAARTTLKRGVELCERQTPPSASVMTALLVALGEAYTSTGAFIEADRALRRALEIAETRLPPGHTRTATVLGAIGFLRFAQGQPGRAEASFRRLLVMLEKNLGPAHPNLASHQLTLASLLVSLGRMEEALPLIVHSRGVLVAARGRSHPDSVFANLSLAIARIGPAPAEAEALLHQTLDDWLTAQPARHATTAKLWNALAAAQFDQGKIDEAVTSAGHAVDIFRAASGPDHLHTVTAMYNQAHYLAAAKRKKESRLVKAEADRIRKEKGYREPVRHTVDIRSLLER